MIYLLSKASFNLSKFAYSFGFIFVKTYNCQTVNLLQKIFQVIIYNKLDHSYELGKWLRVLDYFLSNWGIDID